MKRINTYLTLSMAALLVFALAACNRDRTETSQAERAGEPMAQTMPGGSTALTGADRDFLTQQFLSNQAEMELADMAQQRASNEQVKEYAKQLREDHERANEELRRIADQSQVTLSTEMDTAHRQTTDRLRGLSGQQFDKEFLKQSVEAHQQAIERYQQMAQQATSPELKTYISSQLPMLQQHLQRAQELQSGSTGADRSTGTGKMNQPRY